MREAPPPEEPISAQVSPILRYCHLLEVVLYLKPGSVAPVMLALMVGKSVRDDVPVPRLMI